MMQSKMFALYEELLEAAARMGAITNTTMNDNYVSINIADGNKTYMLVVMLGEKEDIENDPV